MKNLALPNDSSNPTHEAVKAYLDSPEYLAQIERDRLAGEAYLARRAEAQRENADAIDAHNRRLWSLAMAAQHEQIAQEARAALPPRVRPRFPTASDVRARLRNSRKYFADAYAANRRFDLLRTRPARREGRRPNRAARRVARAVRTVAAHADDGPPEPPQDPCARLGDDIELLADVEATDIDGTEALELRAPLRARIAATYDARLRGER